MTAFAPYGLPPTAIKPSYGIAEATLFVSTIAPTAQAYRRPLRPRATAGGEAVRVAADAPGRGRARVVRSDRSQPVGHHRRSRRTHRTPRRASRRDLVARRQHRPAVLAAARRIPADVRRHAAVAATDGKPRRRRTGWSDMAAHRGSRGVPRRRVVCHRPACGHDSQSTVVSTTRRTSRPPTAAASPIVRRGYVAAFSTDDGRRYRRRTRFRHPPRGSGARGRSHPRGCL